MSATKFHTHTEQRAICRGYTCEFCVPITC